MIDRNEARKIITAAILDYARDVKRVNKGPYGAIYTHCPVEAEVKAFACCEQIYGDTDDCEVEVK